MEDTQNKCHCGWIIITVAITRDKQGPDHGQPCGSFMEDGH